MTILEAAAQLRARKISSAELTEAALKRIDSLNPKLNAFLTVTGESAIGRARRADEELAHGGDLGPLHGIPIALKDLFCTAGVATTCGSKLFDGHVPVHDAAVVEKLAAGGAVLLGKTGLHELAYGITSDNPHFGAVRNPWNPECIPGGSSGGSGAAVAAGMAFMAMGSDTGGSIRIPAAFCGTVGLKPTYGRVSRYGAFPLGFSLDHMGPLTRSVRDAAVVLNVIAGFDPRDDTSSRRPVENYLPTPGAGIRGVRIGVPENFYFDHLDEDVDAAVRRTVREAASLGAKLVEVRLPSIGAINAVARLVLLAEASAVLGPHLHRRADIGPDVLALLEEGRLIAATDYIDGQRLRRLYQRQFRDAMRSVDCIVTPTTPLTAPRIGQATATIRGQTEDVRLASTRLVRGINLLGLPALSIPCGADRNNLPAALQIVGKPFGEAMILRVGDALLPSETPVAQL